MEIKKVYKSFEFEVYGTVQRVGFRRAAENQAKLIGVVGYVKNTPKGTVKGVVQGEPEKVALMEAWLTYTGSKRCKIEKMVKTNEKTISSL